MRKAILCLIFATALLGQPTGVQVDLSVVSVDSSSGEVCFKADARTDGAVFDGTDDHISVPDHADLNFGTDGDFTIEAWFKADAVGRQNPIVCKLIGSNPNFTGYQMWVAPDNKLKAFICDGSYTLVASSSTITADTWYYAAFTVDRDGNEKVYLNGSLDCTPVNVSGVGNINTDTTLWIGRATHSPSLAFDGTIAEVRISDVVRTDAEIADAYADGGSFENDGNTIALWHLNEGSGTATGDSSGNGHNGTLTNGATWGNGVIVNPIQGATWSTGLLPTPPEFAYDYDWENDATYDLTDAGDSVCHTYTPGDTLWAMVKATTASYEAEDSAEVIVPEREGYTFDTVLTEEIWEGIDFTPSNWIFDDDGTPWILGNSSWLGDSTDQYQWVLISDTMGSLDTLYSTGERTSLLGNYVLRKFYTLMGADTVIYAGMEDTVINEKRVFDSLLVEPIFGDEPSWSFEYEFAEPLLIRKNGWAFVKIHQYGGGDTLYPNWKYAIAHHGEPDVKIDIEGEVYLNDEYYSLLENRLAVFASSIIGNIYIINVYDTSGALLYSTPELNWCGPACMKFEILSNGSIVYLSGNSNGISLYKQYYSEIDSFEISDTNYIAVSWVVGNNRLFLVYCDWDTGGAYRYYFDLSDSLALIWDCEVTNRWKDSFGILLNNNPFFDIGENLEPNFSWQLKVLSTLDGNIIGEWPNTPFIVRRPPITSIKSNYLLIKDLAEANPPLEARFFIIRIEEGE